MFWKGLVGFGGVFCVVEAETADGAHVCGGEGGKELAHFGDLWGHGMGAEDVAGYEAGAGGGDDVRGGGGRDGVTVVDGAIFGDKADKALGWARKSVREGMRVHFRQENWKSAHANHKRRHVHSGISRLRNLRIKTLDEGIFLQFSWNLILHKRKICVAKTRKATSKRRQAYRKSWHRVACLLPISNLEASRKSYLDMTIPVDTVLYTCTRRGIIPTLTSADMTDDYVGSFPSLFQT